MQQLEAARRTHKIPSEIIDRIGSDNLLFSSDFPHINHKTDAIEDIVGLEERLSKKTVQKLLWDNPIRYYG
jgi:predicted TIM-barrel fold metal-dependent hydrolase